MTTQEATDLVYAFLQKNAGSTKQAITEATEVKGLLLSNALRKLTKDSRVMQDGEADDATFSILHTEPGEEGGSEAEEQETDEDTNEMPASKGRDNSTFKFNGQDLKKGPLVREVVRK